MTEVPTYRIGGWTDFLKVPAARRAECLAEFAVWLEMADSLRGLLEGIPFGLPDEFVWVDDGRHNLTLGIQAGEERIPVASGTMRGFKP